MELYNEKTKLIIKPTALYSLLLKREDKFEYSVIRVDSFDASSFLCDCFERNVIECICEFNIKDIPVNTKFHHISSTSKLYEIYKITDTDVHMCWDFDSGVHRTSYSIEEAQHCVIQGNWIIHDTIL